MLNDAAWVYMMSNSARGVIYTGVTSDLMGRASEHRQKLSDGFARRYNCTKLVWYERHDGIVAAIQREKSLKRYLRDWKINLIEGFNPIWDDLFDPNYALDTVVRHRILGTGPEDDNDRERENSLNVLPRSRPVQDVLQGRPGHLSDPAGPDRAGADPCRCRHRRSAAGDRRVHQLHHDPVPDPRAGGDRAEHSDRLLRAAVARHRRVHGGGRL